MLLSRLFVPTLREDPSEAEAASHRLLVRAGYVRQLAAGLYIYLPLGWKVMQKINAIIREEMDAIGGQEVSMPVLHPAEVWQQTGRWEEIGEEMFRLKDRGGRDMCLGMTHEEIMAWLAAQEIRSYRDLPQVWYQIQTKLRDEARPKSGILRTREFVMKDSYSFDVDEEGLERSYQLHSVAYERIFSRCGLTFHRVESDPGMMGGATAHEYMAPSPAGEDDVALCDACGYAANVELARSVPPATPAADWEYEEVHTPGKRTVEEVSTFLRADPRHFIKSLLYMADGGPVLALVRGDQELHEKKLERVLRSPVRPAHREEVRDVLGVEAGFIGPQGRKVPMIADPALKEGLYISGANREDYHVRGLRAGVHFEPRWEDIHVAQGGDGCPQCGELLRTERCIEIGNIFKLGTKYSVPLRAFFLDEEGAERPIVMGSYGIGPARIAAAAVEQNHDKDGIVWPWAIAPFEVQIIPLNMGDPGTVEVARSMYEELAQAGVDVLMDDRDLRAGVKFKDADLIGVAKHVVVGERGLKEGVVEVKDRQTRETAKMRPEEAVAMFKG
ncbi:MAG: proline--tRNA ligase [Nitrospirota bacterium]